MRNQGFTLMELIVTIALVAVLASLAIPAFQNTVQRNQLAACSNKVASAIQFAKSEAITQRINISVLFGDDGGQPVYQIGSDSNSDGTLDEVLQVLRCEGDALDVAISDNRTFISFGATGFRVDGAGQVTVTTCYDSAQSAGQGRVLTISAGGGVSNTEAPEGACS